MHAKRPGLDIIHKDQPVETAYRTKEWRWKQWRGRYDHEECSKIVETPYKRYPRTHVLPQSIELSIAATTAGEKVAMLDAMTFDPT